jgi:polysaccharide pyruvyl transferase WcaK-like protein
VREVRRLARIAAVARALGRRIALLGVGVGPLRTPAGRHAARRFLRHVDFATVRDPESAALVSALVPLTASVAADLAFLLPSVLAVPRAARTPTPTLGVSLLAYGTSLSGDVDHDEQVATCVADALDTTLRNHPSWCVRFFEFFAGTSEYRDARVLRRVAASMIDPSRVSYREYDGDFLALVPDLQACHAFLGMRFHSSVLSYLADIPFLTVEMHPKCRTALSSRIGQPEAAIVPLAALRDLEIVSRALDRLVSNPAALRPSVDSRQLVRAASDTFDQFRRRFTSRPALAEVAAPRLLGRFIRGARH